MTKGQELSVGLTATCDDDSITLHFDKPGSYRIWRKLPHETSWGAPIWERPIGTEFVDQSLIQPGIAWEYKVQEFNTNAFGYILAGSKIPLVDSKGKLMLIVEATHAAALEKELAQFQADLVGSGYTVLRHDVDKTASPESVKRWIKDAWNADKENVKTVILFGAIPVRMSGPINWDGHGSAMVAADTFYANLDGDWTGNPGIIPGKAQVAVGRIDFSSMTNFSNKPTNPRSELDLLRQYLGRNHAWKTGQWSVTSRGAIRNWFTDRDFSRNAHGNMPQLVGVNIQEIPNGSFFADLKSFDYLIAYADGGGQLTSMDGTGGSDDFATTNIQCPFVMLLGSAMLGRWDVESGFVRSCLASGDDEKGCLVAFGAGAPHVFIHQCGLGEPIGKAWLRSVNNFVIYPATGNPEAPAGGYTPAESDGIPPCLARVHQALFGDPTLTLFPVNPVTNLTGYASGVKLGLAWDAASESSRYHVYRSASANGPFTRLTTDPLTIPALHVGDHFDGLIYMVRAIKLETTPSGSFFSASCGTFWPDTNQETKPPMPPTPGQIMSKATFIEADTTTQGNWIGKYGADGRFIAYGEQTPPTYGTLISGVAEFPWSQNTDDIRALQNAGKRVAAVWYRAIGFEVEIKSDAMPHRLALYCLDWDLAGRSQRVEILDGATGEVLITRSIVLFNEGVWLVFEFQGSVKLRVTKLAGPNAVLSAIMFSPAGATPVPVPTPNTRTLEIQSSMDGGVTWMSKGSVEVETEGKPTEIYRLRIL